MILPIPFVGELIVEDDAFEMTAERLIWRGDSFSFHFSFVESDFGKSVGNGTAQRDSSGRFNCHDLKLRYETDNIDMPAKVLFHRIELNENEQTLFIAGVWVQAGDNFDFSGNLTKYDP